MSPDDAAIDPADRSWETTDPEPVRLLAWWCSLREFQRELLAGDPA